MLLIGLSLAHAPLAFFYSLDLPSCGAAYNRLHLRIDHHSKQYLGNMATGQYDLGTYSVEVLSFLMILGSLKFMKKTNEYNVKLNFTTQ